MYTLVKGKIFDKTLTFNAAINILNWIYNVYGIYMANLKFNKKVIHFVRM